MPATRITLQQVFDSLGYLFRGATSPTDPTFLNNVNLALEQIINSGSWVGCVVPVAFNGSLGYITLPPNMQSIVGVDVHGWPQAVFSQYQEFAELGIGQIKATTQGCGPMIDAGDGHPTKSDIADYGVWGHLKITIDNAADAAKVIRFYGKDELGNVIYDSNGVEGINVTTVSPSVTTTQKFSEITGINVTTPFKGYWHLDGVIEGVTAYRIGDYWPNDLRPDYHRYKTGTLDVTVPIACLCRLRHIPLQSATDWVVPGNLNAIKFGLQAVSAEATRNYEAAQQSWAQCYNLLTQEHRSNRGKARYTAQVNIHGPNQIPVLNSH